MSEKKTRKKRRRNEDLKIKMSPLPAHTPHHTLRVVPNLNNLDKSEFIRKRIVPFLINRIENMNIRIRLLINRIGV